MKSQLARVKRKKAPSSAHRRRAGNKAADFARRSAAPPDSRSKNATLESISMPYWLETHVWHARRAHMADRWGRRHSLQPTEKCFRACYRAAHKDGALLIVRQLNVVILTVVFPSITFCT